MKFGDVSELSVKIELSIVSARCTQDDSSVVHTPHAIATWHLSSISIFYGIQTAQSFRVT